MKPQPRSSIPHINHSPTRTPVRCAKATLAILGLATLSASANFTEYQTAVSNETSLISYYTFEQSNAADAKGTNNGTFLGTATFAAGPAGAGTAIVLDGSSSVNLGVVEDFSFPDDSGTVEAWVKPGALKGAAAIVANRDGYSRYSVHMNSDKAGIGMWNGAAYFPTVAIPNASTNWHHIVMVFESGVFTVYWDGALAGSVFRGLGFTDFTKSTQIGSISPLGNNNESWVGAIDEVAFYANALTADAVRAHWEAFQAGDPPTIVTPPKGGNFLAGAELLLSVKATGPQLQYKWYKGTAPVGQNTNTLLLPSFSAADAGSYCVVVTNTSGARTSAPAVVALGTMPAALARYQAAISNETSLISYYTFDYLKPEDVFGPNEGTLAGTTDWNPGIGGSPAQGLLLDGSGHVNIGAVPAMDFASGEGTVEGWIRADWTTVPSYWPTMYANRHGSTIWSLHLNPTKDTPGFYNGDGTSFFVLPGGAGTNWHHFATVFANGTASFYVDGKLIQFSPMARTLGPGPGTVQIGSSAPTSTAEGWIGMLDEVAFYSTALPVSSIVAHYNAFVAGEPPSITGQPVGGYYLAGRMVQLSVAASGPELTYKWYKDGLAIPDATNAVVGPIAVTPAHSGVYYVTVSNPFGATNSASATIQVGNDIQRYQSTVLAESSLISYYTFDAGDARDAKNAHPGTPANAPAYNPGAGDVTNLSLTLDGSSHIDLGLVPDFDFADGTGTVEGWIQPTWVNPAPYDPCLFADRDGSESVWSVHMERWKGSIIQFSSGPQSLNIPGASGWRHYAIVFNAGTITMYWDGKPFGTLSQTINSSLAKTTQIGSSTPLVTAEGWMGGLDEIAFYSDALAEQKIWDHYLAMVGPSVAPSLNAARNGNQLTISWPQSVTGYTLEYSGALTGTTWTPVQGVANNQVTVDISSGTRFYRLRQ